MMKTYRIRFNGHLYELEVEEVQNSETPAAVVETRSTPTKSAAAPAPTPAPQPTNTSASGEKVLAPMPGTIIDIRVKDGEQVKAGQVLLLLEAMKMENEIVAPKDGTVSGVSISKGASVSAGDLLVTIA